MYLQIVACVFWAVRNPYALYPVVVVSTIYYIDLLLLTTYLQCRQLLFRQKLVPNSCERFLVPLFGVGMVLHPVINGQTTTAITAGVTTGQQRSMPALYEHSNDGGLGYNDA